MAHSVLPDGYDAYVRSWEERIGAFIEFRPDAPSAAGGPLAGLPFAVKDNIAVKGYGLTCGSKLLKDMKAPYTATCVKKLQDSGAFVVGKTNLDEFGMGSSTDNSGLKTTNNPWDTSRVAGGSSGGSAAAVAAGLVPFALGTDTGGSVRQPAAFCGVVGLKPTYGAVSRFGLVAYASSLETPGLLADTAARTRKLFSIIRGADPLDQTTMPFPADSLDAGPDAAPKTIGVLTAAALAAALGTGAETGEKLALLEPEVEASFKRVREELKALGHRLVDVSLPSLKYAVPTYYTIATAEASANLARFDGIRYGARPAFAENPEELIDKTRGAGFGAEVKLRVLLGTFVLRSGFQDQYYNRAQKLRTGIRRDFDRVLSGVDAILMPVFPTRAFGRGDAGLSQFAQKAADVFTCCANLAGLPALSFPAGVEGGLPVGVQLVGWSFGEAALLDVAEGYEKAHPAARPAGSKAFWG